MDTLELDDNIQKILRNPSFLFEGLGPDGVTMPYSTHKALLDYINTDYASELAHLVINRDYYELGKLLAEQAIEYARSVEEEIQYATEYTQGI